MARKTEPAVVTLELSLPDRLDAEALVARIREHALAYGGTVAMTDVKVLEQEPEPEPEAPAEEAPEEAPAEEEAPAPETPEAPAEEAPEE